MNRRNKCKLLALDHGRVLDKANPTVYSQAASLSILSQCSHKPMQAMLPSFTVEPRPLAIPRQNRRERIAQNSYNKGSWSTEEKLLFLKGLRIFGTGKWKEIGTILTSR